MTTGQKKTNQSQQTTTAQPGGLSRAKCIAFSIIIFLCLAVTVEFLAGKFMTEPLRIGRRILLGAESTHLIRMQNTIGQPYLLYNSAPNFEHPHFGKQNNEDGYRGQAVALDRQPGILRILCLGGSTTYGTGVGRANQSYPAVLEELLREDLPPGFHGVEVINGGLSWGTTAELLTHYHFKYHYYRPDLVIINTGGNDAQGYTLPYYHPDNSNWRQPMVNLRPLPKAYRWLAYSRLTSIFILNAFYSDQLYGGQFVIRDGRKPDAPWFKPNGQLIETAQEIPLEQLSFLHNLETLIQNILDDNRGSTPIFMIALLF